MVPSFVFQRVSFSDLSLLCHHITSSLSPWTLLLPSPRTLVITFRAHPHNPGPSPHLKVLTSITSAKYLCQVTYHFHRFQVSGCGRPGAFIQPIIHVLCPQGGGMGHTPLFQVPVTLVAPVPARLLVTPTPRARSTEKGYARTGLKPLT